MRDFPDGNKSIWGMRAGVSNGNGALEEISMAANGPLRLRRACATPPGAPLLGHTPPKWQSYFLHPPPPALLAVLPSSQPTVLHSRTLEMTLQQIHTPDTPSRYCFWFLDLARIV